MFLHDITTYRWEDGGSQADDLFAWIPRDAQSPNEADATRAGETAHAIASFLSEEFSEVASEPANPDLMRAFAASLIPYLGAMVGDASEVSGFAPLDGLDSPMRHTTALFAAMSRTGDPGAQFSKAAAERAGEYEKAFATTAAANSVSAGAGEPERNLLQAARLRALIAAGEYLADPQPSEPTAAHAQTQVTYEVASVTARAGNPTIDPKFFDGKGRLLPPDQISCKDWSVYDSQLSVYLAAPPAVNEAISAFGRVFQRIASQA